MEVQGLLRHSEKKAMRQRKDLKALQETKATEDSEKDLLKAQVESWKAKSEDLARCIQGAGPVVRYA